MIGSVLRGSVANIVFKKPAPILKGAGLEKR